MIVDEERLRQARSASGGGPAAGYDKDQRTVSSVPYDQESLFRSGSGRASSDKFRDILFSGEDVLNSEAPEIRIDPREGVPLLDITDRSVARDFFSKVCQCDDTRRQSVHQARLRYSFDQGDEAPGHESFVSVQSPNYNSCADS